MNPPAFQSLQRRGLLTLMASAPLWASGCAALAGGRPGAAVPGWSAMLALEEADWVAQQLAEGFPGESRRPARGTHPPASPCNAVGC